MFKQKISLRRVHLFLLPFLFLSFIGCSSGVVTNKTPTDAVVHRIAVIPFQKSAREDINIERAHHPLAARSFKMDSPSSSPEKVVEDSFTEQIRIFPKLAVYGPDVTGGIFSRNSVGSSKASVTDVIRKVGRELGADGVVVGYVYRWRQLKGTPYGAEKPASVSFDIQLFRVSDGVLIWRGIFDHTQTSLMENMFNISIFVQGGGRWVTVEELAGVGVKETIKTFPTEK